MSNSNPTLKRQRTLSSLLDSFIHYEYKALPLLACYRLPLLCPTPCSCSQDSMETWIYKSNLSHLWAQADVIQGVKEVNKVQSLLGDSSPIFWKAGRLGALVTPASSQLQCSHSGSLEFSTGNRNALKWEVHPANVSVLDGCTTSSCLITTLVYLVGGSCRQKSKPWKTCLCKLTLFLPMTLSVTHQSPGLNETF